MSVSKQMIEQAFKICEDVAVVRIDGLKAEIKMLKSELRQAHGLIGRYLEETPLGNQPHMIAHQAEAWLKANKENI